MNKKIKRTDFLYGLYMLLQVVLIILVSILMNDLYYKIITACLGTLYVGLTAKGIRYGFCIGWVYVILLCITSFVEKLYASALFMVFLLPMMIFSFINWGKNTANNEVEVKLLTKKQLLFALGLSVIALGILFFILKLLHGSQPLVDALFFVVSGVAGVLILLRYYEMWITSAISGIMGCVMWLIAIINGSSNYSLLLLNFFVLLNAIFALYKWHKIRVSQLTINKQGDVAAKLLQKEQNDNTK